MMFSDVYLYVIPREAVIHSLTIKGYIPERDGQKLSDTQKVIFNKVQSTSKNPAYSIVYRDDVFTEMKIDRLLYAIINTFAKNTVNTNMRFHMHYKFITLDGDEEYDMYESTVGIAVDNFSKFCSQINESHRLPIFNYDIDALKELRKDIEAAPKVKDDGLDNSDDEDSDEDDDEIAYNPFNALMDREIPGPKKKSKKKKDKESKKDDIRIYRSKVLRNAKNPKRDISRHGILIANKKSDIEKDREVIKDFLKEFIPGDKPWIKKYRKALLNRWVDMFAITKKTLKRHEEDYRQEKRRKLISDGYIAIGKSIGVTSRLISHATDKWNDPNL